MGIGNDKVIYHQCPHCKVGWYGKILGYTEDETGLLSSIRIQGMDEVDLMKPLRCLTCGHTYTPIVGGYMEDGQALVNLTNGINIHVMSEWIARMITTIKGK